MTMTTYFTAADGTSQVATAGPADPNAGVRGKIYAGLAVLTPLMSFLAAFGVLTGEQVNGINTFLSSAVGLAGLFGFGFAAKKVSDQKKNGTFEAAPNLPVLNTFEQLNAIKVAVDDTVTTTQQQVAAATAAIQNATAALPGGALVSGAVGVGSQAVSDLLAAVRAVDGQ
jgi:hypothetical protein